jgi:toxin ParE1/3/4
MAVIWSRRAREDLAAIFRFIASDDRAAAARWVARLIERGESLAALPRTGRVVPELGRGDLRELVVRTYRIVYRVDGEQVRILTVFEGHRLLRASDLDDASDPADRR